MDHTPKDERWMKLALGLARRSLGKTSGNPAVGCVIVKDGLLLGRGSTAKGGRPHAETVALAQAGTAAKGATAYVSLEPCSHHGKTPPCTDALIKAGISRVVCALEDPDPRVYGQGFKALRDSGITVVTDVLHDEAAELNQGFLLNRTIGRPMFTLKMASSIDGRIATASGESRWITGEVSRRYVHLMRANHDAVLIGAGTARTDDPLLDIRGMGMQDQSPVRIVIDGGLSLSLTSRLARTASDVPLWLCHRGGLDHDRLAAWKEVGAELIEVSHSETGELDLGYMAQKLGALGINSVLCEGGGQVAASLINAQLVDQLVCFTAGKAIGADGQPMLGNLNMQALAEKPKFRQIASRRLGNDVMTRWIPTST